MPIISKIEKIKRQKGWFEINLDDGSSFPSSDELILKYLIKKGNKLSAGEVKQIREEGEYKFLKKKAFDALARRRLSEKELRKRLKTLPQSRQYIDRLLDDLKSLGLIDDLGYAAAVIHTLQAGGSKSKRYMRNKLYQKGIAGDISKKALETELADYDEAEAALKIAQKKYKSVRNLSPLKARKRIADFLRGRGFGWDDINYALDKLLGRND